jgi:mRNA interferase RelE/StbE
MPYTIEFGPAAADEVRKLRKTDQVKVLAQCQSHLTHEPTKNSKSRIKRLQGDVFPPFRLRVDDFRVFYDVDEANKVVIIHGVVEKSEADEWLQQSTDRRRSDEGSKH